MKKFLFSTFLLLHLFLSLHAVKIDIVSNFSLDLMAPCSKMEAETGLQVRMLYTDFETYRSSIYSKGVKKIILMNDFASPKKLSKFSRKKLVLFLWEPGGAKPSYCDLFSRTYTYNDDLVNGENYFKFFYPVLISMFIELPQFENKKLCVMIATNPESLRVKMVNFFETKPEDDFDFYGKYPIVRSSRYRGSIPGHPMSEEKLEILKKYRFCVCFENTAINGYVTEKIFACFAAGCVPIYWGAPNVENYIPKDCFIDYRDFQSNEELYQYIKNMPEDVYQKYIDNIRTYLQSDKAFPFSVEHFNQTILEAALAP